MMNVAYIINHLGPSGVNNVVKDLVTLMIKNGHLCTIYYFKDVDASLGYPCKTIKVLSWKSKIDFSNYDVVHCHGLLPMMNVLWNGYKERAFQLITTLHCYCYQDFQDLYGKVKGYMMGVLYLYCARKFDKIVCLSKDMMTYYRTFIPKSKLNVVYNTRIINNDDLSLLEKRELHDFKGASKLIGMNGVLIYRKGVDLMLEALAKLPDNYKLFIVGEGPERENFENKAQELGIINRVKFAGQRTDAFRYLPYYDIFALPSRSEGFPLALLEAAAMGKIAVVSDLPIVKECFEKKKDIVCFSMKEGVNGLVNAILLTQNLKGLGNALKQKYEKYYSPKAFYNGYIQIYSSLKNN